MTSTPQARTTAPGNELCPGCRAISDRELHAVMEGSLPLWAVDLSLAGWWHAGSFEGIRLDTPARVESIPRSKVEGPSFPALCERRGEPDRATAHNQRLGLIMDRLSQVEGGRK